ncbi:MAG: hypothetical protein U1F35_15315 [Steroidobacteraceae bacterium]|nr:hypothetical protein [Pseudomonadota bacterium]
MPRKSRVATLVLGAALLGACDLTGSLASRQQSNVQPSVSPAAPGAASIAAVLDLMVGLHQTDPGRQAEVFQAAKDAAELTPTTSNKLRYAVALATPGHSATDPVAAQRQLSELLARPETLLPMERNFALAELNEVEHLLVLQAENKRLRDEDARESRDRQQSSNRRLQAEIEENARLRKALDEAQAKLDAVTHIERSINDRTTPAPRKP